ncbi:MAG: iron ABC transporter permease [Phycisphaeraceae bacterium]|nr:iron ABC transporter permease [Phycisphaeraceae bacterium]
MSSRAAIAIGVLVLVLIGAVALRLGVGGSLDSLPEAARGQVWILREQRALAAIVVGMSLAIGGVMLQSLLRNPLASPDLLGLSSGAALAVMLAMYLAATWTGSSTESAPYSVAGWHAGPALLGSIAALALVYALSQRRGLVDPPTLVLIGVIVSIMCGAATMLLQHLMPDRGIGAARLLMGAISDDVTWPQLAAVGGIAVIGLGAGLWAGPAMDAAAMGDDEAVSVGVPLSRLRLALFILAGAMTAGAVVIAGPIGFVGLICPHLARLLTGRRGASAGHRVLVLASALLGASLIVAADALVKSLDLASGRLPIGVLTALLGGPAFIVLLRRTRAMA